MKKRRMFALVMSILMVFSLLAGCNNNANQTSESSAPSESSSSALTIDTDVDKVDASDERYPLIRQALQQTPSDLAPWDVYTGDKQIFLPLMYECLFNFSRTEGYVPWLAKGYEIIDDLHYQVELFENIEDSKGNQLTADDIVFCYENLVSSGYAVKYDMFESVKKVDDLTVEFTWAYPLTGILELEHVWCKSFMYTTEAYNSYNLASEAVGTGPYALTSYVGGSTITMDARDDYWKGDSPDLFPKQYRNVQTIEYQVITEAFQNVVALQTGAVDVSTLVPSEDVGDFEDGGTYDDDYNTLKLAGNEVYFMICNMEQGITTDENFRLALYYALNKEAIASAVGNVIPTEKFGSPAHPDLVDEWADRDDYNNAYNLDLAKEYLAKSGYNGEKLKIMGYNNEVLKNTMTMIQSLLLQIGVETEILAYDMNLVNSSLTDPDAYDLLVNFIGGNPLISGLNRILSNKEYGNDKSLAFIDDDELQELFETARTADTWNDESMTALYDHIIDNAYFKTLYSPISTIVHTSAMVESFYDPGANAFFPNGCTYNLG